MTRTRVPWLPRAAMGLLMLSVALPAHAAEQPKCEQSRDFLVVSRGRTDGVGDDIYARAGGAGAAAPCQWAPRASDFRLSRSDPNYVVAVRGKYLAVDYGTGPDRRLLIFDLAARKRLLANDYDSNRTDPIVADETAISFWKVEPGPVALTACPPGWIAPPDLPKDAKAHRTTQVRVVLADARVVATGARGCTVTQDDM